MGLVCQALQPECMLQHDDQCDRGVEGVYAYLDSIKPGRFLMGTQ